MDADDAASILEILRQMREADTHLRAHGAIVHKYRLGRPLTESEVQGFESKHGLRLPADYRSFVRNVGDGGPVRSNAPLLAVNSGAGPGCGVLPLEETTEECDPSREFPLTESVEVCPYPGIERWGEEEAYPGVLQISYGGSACYDFLVVNGPAYGTVWGADVDIRNFGPIAPSFGAWYRRWAEWMLNTGLSHYCR